MLKNKLRVYTFIVSQILKDTDCVEEANKALADISNALGIHALKLQGEGGDGHTSRRFKGVADIIIDLPIYCLKINKK